MRNISFVPSFHDAAHYAIPLHFLRVVQLVASWYTPGMEVA
jgi:hypothetical protein